MSARCEVLSCERGATSRTAELRTCLMHYKRWKRHGDVNARTRAFSPPKPDKDRCSVEGCESMEDGASGFCKMHDTRFRRHGDPDAVTLHKDRDLPRGTGHYLWTGAEATYGAAHQRVRSARGPAFMHPCADCGKVAAHWAYDRADPAERHATEGPYSTNPEHYEPRCVPCHKAFDLSAIRRSA